MAGEVPAGVADGAGARPGPAAAAGYPSAARAWWAVGVFVLTILLAFIDKLVVALLVQPLKASLLISDTRIGLLQGVAFSLFAAVAALPLGRLVDRVNRIRMLAACVVAWSTFTMLSGFAGGFWELFAFRVGVGVGEACIMPMLYSLLADFFPPRRRPTAMLVFYLATVICASLAVSLGGAALGALASGALRPPEALAGLEDWRLAFLLVGAPGPLVAALILLSLREPARQERVSLSGAGVPARTVLAYLAEGRGAFLALIVGSSVALAVGNAVNAWYPSVLVRGFGLSPSEAGIRYGFAAAVSALASVPVALFAERALRPKLPAVLPRLLLLGTVLAAVFSVAAALAETAGAGLALAGCILFGLYWIVALTPVLVQEIAPNEMRGQVLALGALISTVLQGLSPVLVGLLSDRVFTGPRGLALSLAAAALPCLALAGLLYLRLPAAHLAARARLERRMAAA